MLWWIRLRMRLRSLFRKETADRELDDELQFHLEQFVSENLSRGMNAAEAQRAARRSLGGLDPWKEECRDERRLAMVEEVVRDIRYALRLLRKSPTFATVAILSLAVGIGANTAVFSALNALMFRPLPVPEPSRLIQFTSTQQLFFRSSFTYPLFEALESRAGSLATVFAWGDAPLRVRTSGGLTRLDSVLVSGDYFRGLGVGPQTGRLLLPGDTHTVVLGDAFWSREFGRDPGVIGRTLEVEGLACTIVGVAPRDFFGADIGERPDLFVPTRLASEMDEYRDRLGTNFFGYTVMGRLNRGVTIHAVRQHLESISREAWETAMPLAVGAGQPFDFHGQILGAEPGATGVSPYRSLTRHPLLILLALAGIVLLAAATNVANLQLARGTARQREYGVRRALGAGGRRLIRQLVTESLVLALLGGAVGLVFAYSGSQVLARLLSTEGLLLDARLDSRILAATIVFSLVAAALFGTLPAWRAARLRVSGSLNQVRATSVGSPSVGRSGWVSIVAQVALSVVLTYSAILFAGTLRNLRTTPLGFDPRNLMLIEVSVDEATLLGSGARLAADYQLITDQLARSPGVESAAWMRGTPVKDDTWIEFVSLPGRPPLDDQDSRIVVRTVGPRYFETLRTPVLEGREFSNADITGAPHVAILNETASRTFFPEGSAVGRQISLGDPPEGIGLVSIVGVAEDAIHEEVRYPAPPMVYLPAAQHPTSLEATTFALRSGTGADAAVTSFRQALRRTVPAAVIDRVETLNAQLDDRLRRERLVASASVFFGLAGLALTAIGLYGVLIYLVTRRTAEIGVRMALGARRKGVIWLVTRRACVAGVAGLLLGVAGSVALSRTVTGMVFGIRPADPLWLGSCAALVVVVMLAGAAVPAFRASRIDPATALRVD